VISKDNTVDITFRAREQITERSERARVGKNGLGNNPKIGGAYSVSRGWMLLTFTLEKGTDGTGVAGGSRR
jgi:hypothetical protein